MHNGTRTDWFHDARWGVFSQWFTSPKTSAEAWNARVDGFDVDGLAGQLSEVGAPYYFLSIGQNSGHYCAPNATYDRLTGIRPSKCSRRDLFADLAAALGPRGIRLLAYLPSGAPTNDPEARRALEWEWGFKDPWPGGWGGPTTGKRLAAFQRKWESICREWSLRWSESCGGWWIDGCYFGRDMYAHDDEPNWSSFAAALRAGNPDSILAFNPGTLLPLATTGVHEDFTTGEVSHGLPVNVYEDNVGQWAPMNRWVDGTAQAHVLSDLGFRVRVKYPDEMVVGYTRFVTGRDGVISWWARQDAGGLIVPEDLAQLAAVGKAMAR